MKTLSLELEDKQKVIVLKKIYYKWFVLKKYIINGFSILQLFNFLKVFSNFY